MPLPRSTAPLTVAESSGYTRTALHAEVLTFIEQLRAMGDARLHVGDFGHTPEGRLLPLLVLSENGHCTPDAAQRSGLPVVLVICGIHAGEVEGKEAGLMLVRDLLAGAHGDLLRHFTLLLVPLFNADGNDRISPQNRVLEVAQLRGQDGPDGGVGTRNTAAGINLNRDYLRLQAPEMVLLQTRVCQPWNAHLCIDCHATNGSIHRFALSYDIPHTEHSGRHEPVEYMRARMMPAVRAAVQRSEQLDIFWYGNFLRDEGGSGTGWITYTHHPRFGGNYRGLGNRLDLLLETYAYQPFAQRVLSTYTVLRETLVYVAAHGAEILALLEQCGEPPDSVAVRYRLEAWPGQLVDVPTRAPYHLQGAPVVVRVPHYARFVPDHLVRRPVAYAVPAHVGAHLKLHGLAVHRPLGNEPLQVEVAIVGALVSTAGREILEANGSTYCQAVYRAQTRQLPPGWVLVPTAQQRGAVAVYLCEAGSDDGLVACGLIMQPAPGSEFPAWRVLA